MFVRPKLLILQPTTLCNCACNYCYLKETSPNRMSSATLALIAERVVARIEPEAETLVVWHGGEPTTLPPTWFRHATTTLARAKSGRPLRFSLQTNGVALTEEWADFLAESGTEVGLSLDGPQDLHDRSRKTRSGRGTWRAAMDALARLRARDIEPGIITVLTRESLDRPRELLDFYMDNDLHVVGFSPEETEGRNRKSSLSESDAPAKMTRFLVDFMGEAVRRNYPIHLREAERILACMASETVPDNEQIQPFGIITVDWQGGIYSFSPELTEHVSENDPYLRLGSVHEGELAALFDSPNLSRTLGEIEAGVRECAPCPYWSICGGGAPVNRLAETGSLTVGETHHCRLTVQATAQALHALFAAPAVPISMRG